MRCCLTDLQTNLPNTSRKQNVPVTATYHVEDLGELETHLHRQFVGAVADGTDQSVVLVLPQ